MDEQLELDLNFGGPAIFDEEPFEPQSMVEHFHWRFNAGIDERTPEVVGLRRKLLSEEFRELRDELVVAHQALALGKPIPNLDKISKEMGDLLYVTYGAAVALGIDAEEAFRRVHASNMSKLGVDNRPVVRDDGKVLKGPNYFEPDMSGVYREEND